MILSIRYDKKKYQTTNRINDWNNGICYAANSLNARNITIDNSNMSEISDNKLDTALNYLYEKASKVGQCPGGQVCTTSTFANNALTMSSNSGMCLECVYTYTTSTWYSSSHESVTVLTDEHKSW